MGIFTTIASALGGPIFGGVKDLINEYFPPDMSEEDKAKINLKIMEMEYQKKIEIQKLLADAEKSLNERIAQQEGTAHDLKQLPVVGRLVLFLRGLQRPLWGFFTMYLDFNWFINSPTHNEQQQTALIVVNVLVLGFLFGERAVKNLEPLITKVFGKNT